MYCSKCGYEIQDGVAFCAKCGAGIEPQQQNPGNQEQYGEHQTFKRPEPSVSPAEAAAAESSSIASLVMGIIGIVASALCAGIITGPLAIMKGNEARRVLTDKNYHFHMALAGVITGSVGLAFSIFFVIYWVIITLVLVSVITPPALNLPFLLSV